LDCPRETGYRDEELAGVRIYASWACGKYFYLKGSYKTWSEWQGYGHGRDRGRELTLS